MRTTRAARAREGGAKVEVANGVSGAEQYVSAFARVRLVRAWIAAAAALVAMLYAFVALLERMLN